MADTFIPPTPGEPVAQPTGRRPVMVAIAGDSAAGKTTLTAGLVAALGPDRVTASAFETPAAERILGVRGRVTRRATAPVP